MSRLADVEKVNARPEEAALTTARALAEIAGHWDAVYEAMPRKDTSHEAPERCEAALSGKLRFACGELLNDLVHRDGRQLGGDRRGCVFGRGGCASGRCRGL